MPFIDALGNGSTTSFLVLASIAALIFIIVVMVLFMLLNPLLFDLAFVFMSNVIDELLPFMINGKYIKGLRQLILTVFINNVKLQT